MEEHHSWQHELRHVLDIEVDILSMVELYAHTRIPTLHIYTPSITIYNVYTVFIHLSPTSRLETGPANLVGEVGPVAVRRGLLGNLHRLAQRRDVHPLPVANRLHAVDELAGAAVGAHVAGNVLVPLSALLVEADAVVVSAEAVAWVLERRGHGIVGQDAHARLCGNVSAWFPLINARRRTSVMAVVMAAMHPCQPVPVFLTSSIIQRALRDCTPSRPGRLP